MPHGHLLHVATDVAAESICFCAILCVQAALHTAIANELLDSGRPGDFNQV
jgi:hypothetical protein